MAGDGMARLTIRPAGAGEHAALLALMTRSSLANPGDREALLANPDAIELPPAQIAAGRVFVAGRGGAALGFVALEPRPDGGLEVDGLFVEPGRWRQGIGRALIQHACAVARAEGVPALHVVAGVAEGFYVTCGFRRVGTSSTRFGPAVKMRLDLAGG